MESNYIIHIFFGTLHNSTPILHPLMYLKLMHEFLTFPCTFSIDTDKEEEKENGDQVPLEEKQPIKTSRSKGKQHKAEKCSLHRDPRSTSPSVQNGRQEIQAAEHGANEDMNLMQVTSVLKDLQSLSTALLTMDKESEDSMHSV